MDFVNFLREGLDWPELLPSAPEAPLTWKQTGKWAAAGTGIFVVSLLTMQALAGLGVSAGGVGALVATAMVIGRILEERTKPSSPVPAPAPVRNVGLPGDGIIPVRTRVKKAACVLQ